MPQAVAAEIGAARGIVGTQAQAAWPMRRRADHDLGWIGQHRALGIACERARYAKPRRRGIGGKIAGKETVGRIVAMVVAVVVLTYLGVNLPKE